MAADLVNLVSTERLAKGTRLRVTFAQAYAGVVNSEVARRFNTIYAQIASTKLMYPVSPDPTIASGQTHAVIDIHIVRDRIVAADVLNALDHLAGFYVTVKRVEKLEHQKATVAASNTGARERERAQTEQQRRDDWRNVLPDFSRLVSIVKWTLAAVIVLGVAYLVFGARRVIAAVKP